MCHSLCGIESRWTIYPCLPTATWFRVYVSYASTCHLSYCISDSDAVEVFDEIAAITQCMMDAYNSGDPSGVCQLFSDDCKIMPSGAPLQSGRNGERLSQSSPPPPPPPPHHHHHHTHTNHTHTQTTHINLQWLYDIVSMLAIIPSCGHVCVCEPTLIYSYIPPSRGKGLVLVVSVSPSKERPCRM